ncbi:hypothetical protein EV200_102462 [Pedobacter psychrotolerans]|uniref:Phosphatidylcholine 1-acylhydrolase n=1 Tax=Pedobacter psychrotolerans TaxID=1843235 RepID=A0A4R2HIE3_9SPHI|nr:hypothetical protein [Pedobacter psychrotolerans]TCO29043.1 hypothetical protein EV200_102462 [Pedobacter psychrotolerans]GGE53619.1 hypothetical protein GCM10011413_20090 [Pedobacter psychrotolerans]
MMKTLLTLTFSFLWFHLLAQDSLVIKRELANKQYINLYKENSDFSYTSPAGELGAPSKYVINGRLTTTYMLLGSYKSPVAFSIIPDFTVRVRNEASAGVRTPSYRLGGVLYARLNINPENYKYAEMAFTHHSNGQDQDALNTNGSVNTLTGNFNANYLTASYRFGHLTETNADESYYSFNHRVGLQWYKFFRYEPALDLGYGFTRLLYNFSWRKYGQIERNARNKPKVKTEKETWRLNTEVSYAVNKIPAKNLANLQKRLNAEINFNYSLPFMNNVFLMAAVGYYGEDNYNIYFQDHYGYLRFGLSSGFLRNRSKHYDN